LSEADRAEPLRGILHVASEVTPWSQTGGLGEVVGSLPAAIAGADPSLRVAVVSPLYRVVRERAAARGARLDDTGLEIAVALPAADHVVRLVRLADDGPVATFFLDCPPLYDREGIYGGPGGDHPDNWLRFGVLCRAAIAAGPAMLGGPVDLFHAHDWQAALVPLYLRRQRARARSVVTIHNLGFQGVFDDVVVPGLGLDWSLYTSRCLEHHGRANLLKGGMATADRVTTVSPTYAAEIRTPGAGETLDGFLRHDIAGVRGIRNGIDDRSWDPASDPSLPATFDAADRRGKARCRSALVQARGLRIEPRDLLLGMISRLTAQKGADLVANIVPELQRMRARLVLLGSGDPALEERFRWLARHFGHHVSVEIGFDPALARRILAGADAVLMPSRFEPCGLTQLYAMRYGAVPIVNPVGGLRDTVTDPGDHGLSIGQGTGFAMAEPTASGLRAAIARASRLHVSPTRWGRAVRACMAADFSWRGPAAEYAALYHEVLGESPAAALGPAVTPASAPLA
jgi:starch synthase